MTTDPASILLAATRDFLRSTSEEGLGSAVLAALDQLLRPDKANVFLADEEGRMCLVAATGFAESELARLRGTVEHSPGPLPLRVARGDELWTDTEDLGPSLARWGAAGFAIPIRGASDVVGMLATVYVAPRTFDPDAREQARALAAQAGLAWELIASRRRIGRQAELLETRVEERTAQLRAVVAELEIANAAKSAFLADVSHELRTPLTTILGFAEVLSSGLDGPLTDAQLEDVTTIEASSRRLLALIDDLLDVGRIDAARRELEVGLVDLPAIVADALALARPTAAAAGLELLGEDAGMPAEVVADEQAIRHILRHLLGNAVRFTPAGGRIRVVGSRGPDGARIDVEDTGIGIDPRDHERVFEPFVRLGGSAYPGSGVGLALSRGLARLHGGDLRVTSASGAGSRFTLTLPIGHRHDGGSPTYPAAPTIAPPSSAPAPIAARPTPPTVASAN